ncbi:MAG: septum formation initiator family protein [Elusimicrobiota bacterium]|jgi:cell division protein FtsB|nr:septum formation initiator family protein [Elusimicrobiota bacterium]
MRYKRNTILNKFSNAPSNKRFKKKMIYFLFALSVLFLLLNEGGRDLIRLIIDKNTLENKIQTVQEQNTLLKTRLHNLENEPGYFEKTVRSELGVIAPGEIEYRFKSKFENKK